MTQLGVSEVRHVPRRGCQWLAVLLALALVLVGLLFFWGRWKPHAMEPSQRWASQPCVCLLTATATA